MGDSGQSKSPRAALGVSAIAPASAAVTAHTQAMLTLLQQVNSAMARANVLSRHALM